MGIRAWSFFFMTDDILGFYNSLRWHLKLAYLPPNVSEHHIPDNKLSGCPNSLTTTISGCQGPWH